MSLNVSSDVFFCFITFNNMMQDRISFVTKLFISPYYTHLNCLFATLQSNFIIATDGSANDGKGSFGWVIANSDGNVIVTGQGTAFGDNISSFRCEAYGILAALCFILQLHQYYHLHTTSSGGVIARVCYKDSTQIGPIYPTPTDTSWQNTTSNTQLHTPSSSCP